MKTSALRSELSRLRREEMMPIETADRIKAFISELKKMQIKTEKQTAKAVRNLIDAVIWEEEDNPYIHELFKDFWSKE